MCDLNLCTNVRTSAVTRISLLITPYFFGLKILVKVVIEALTISPVEDGLLL